MITSIAYFAYLLKSFNDKFYKKRRKNKKYCVSTADSLLWNRYIININSLLTVLRIRTERLFYYKILLPSPSSTIHAWCLAIKINVFKMKYFKFLILIWKTKHFPFSRVACVKTRSPNSWKKILGSKLSRGKFEFPFYITWIKLSIIYK